MFYRVSTIPESDFDSVRGESGFCRNEVCVIPGASHHVYADQSRLFNREVELACKWSDQKDISDSEVQREKGEMREDEKLENCQE